MRKKETISRPPVAIITMKMRHIKHLIQVLYTTLVASCIYVDASDPFVRKLEASALFLQGHDRHRGLETAEERTTGRKDCKIVEKCEVCTYSEQKSVPVCKETGRKQKMECTALDGDDQKQVADYYSCQYTEADEEFAMIRLQMFCLLVGSMAFMSVRRQKRVTASLFDQRKQAAEAAREAKKTRRSSDLVESGQEEQIEFSTMRRNSNIDEESIPLIEMTSNPLAVI